MSSLKSLLVLLAGASLSLAGTIGGGNGYGNVNGGGGGGGVGSGNVGGGGVGYGNNGGGRGSGNVGSGRGYGNVNGGESGNGGGGSDAGVGVGGNGYGNNLEQPVAPVLGGGGGGGSSAAYGSNDSANSPAACGTPGDCYANGCDAAFLGQWNVTGVCAAGQYVGCACTKCGAVNGPCDANDCAGVAGICQGGPYQGCECGRGPLGVQQY